MRYPEILQYILLRQPPVYYWQLPAMIYCKDWRLYIGMIETGTLLLPSPEESVSARRGYVPQAQRSSHWQQEYG